MDWRVTTVARSLLVTRCALTWSSVDLASGDEFAGVFVRADEVQHVVSAGALLANF
jgi:hypothetical protein